MNTKITEAMSQWNDDGGSQLRSMAVSSAVEKIDEEDRVILAFLGMSVISLWDDLPAEQQKKILNTEAIRDAFDKAEIKSRLERLEEHLKPILGSS
ncbi:hypothetical protein [Alcaligenes endophyticus]|uniref:Uncharacterized protein n=1 Tax=Alcaligenes endophyticus TaxID=1929088 RepID=A0ABT8EJ69_9BURK|nr:hypothetical protein [Alcaligenes endophyticus]MCX5591662.1 hypothetical protein [Alcaligenes endophyticus]MDN4121339.1 hypothetical protein [Alcaligenes endophyticus]